MTDPSAAYGTTEIALAVHDLWRHTGLPDDRVLVMGGHEDGVVAFGRSPEEAGRTLLTWLARAYEMECRGLDPGLSGR